jgi:GDP-L-fucose synthase
MPLQQTSKIFVAGHSGLVGSAIWRTLKQRNYMNLVGKRSAELDLRDARAVEMFFVQERPEVVILAAAKVGGIMANKTYPANFIADNLSIQVNVIDTARRHGVERLLFLGSSCIYPKLSPQPIKEEYLLTGLLEPTNDAYAIAKIAGLIQVQANRRQHNVSFISAMPTNLYGPGDNFDLETAHVLPALMRKMHEAKMQRAPMVTVWGSGKPRREFLYINDLADACIHLLHHYDGEEPINIGVGKDLSILELAYLIADVVGFSGELTFDVSKPDGAPRKLLDTSKINTLGWRAQTPLRMGLKKTYDWYLKNL